MEKTVKIGEIETEMTGDISTSDILNVFLRIGWGAETTTKMEFNPAEDLNTGDGIRVIIEKVYQEPEPEPEVAAAEVTGEAKAECEAPAAEAAGSPEAEAQEETPTCCEAAADSEEKSKEGAAE